MKHQLQELEETIRLRNQYLQAQDNQIQRNQDRIQDQKAQLNQNAAALKKQSLKFISLTVDSDRALKALKKQAEKEPSQRVIQLHNQIDSLNRELFSLSLTEKQTANAIAEASETLSILDGQIIEADTLFKEMFQRIEAAKKKWKQAERDASFQVAIVTDLQNDVKDLQEQYTALEASKILSTQEKDSLNKQIKAQQAKLDTITNEITERQTRLKTLQVVTNVATKNLAKIGDTDKVIREDLADKKLRLQEEAANIKARKVEIKKEELERRQLDPNAKVFRSSDNSKGYYKT